MKIVKKYINKKKRIFAVRMNLDSNSDDVWNLYNLLSTGDLFTGTCHRKVQKESLGLVKIEKKVFVCTLAVSSFAYDTEADSLRVNGLNAKESKWIGLGAQQAITVIPPRQVMIVKRDFDSQHVRLLNQMITESEQGHLVALTMEEGLAHIFLVSQQKTMLKAKIEKSTRKAQHLAKKSVKNKFFESVLKQLHFNFTGDNAYAYKRVNCIIVGSPGFVAENFYNFLKAAATSNTRQETFVKDMFSKTIIGHCSSGWKHSLNELLGQQNVQQRIASMSCASEVAMLDKFFEVLALTPDKVTYGPKSVEVALREAAVETLLISDKLFRNKDIARRKFYVGLHDQGQRDGLRVVVFSSLSPSGERLNNMTGIAAILRYAIPQLDDMVDAEEDEGDINSDDSDNFEVESDEEDQSLAKAAIKVGHAKEETKDELSSHSEQDEVDNQIEDLFGDFDADDYGDEDGAELN